MPFDGNGNWTSNFNAEADRNANIKIEASRFDNILLADIAQSFENCLTKDMQVKPQQNFNANNFRLINVADPVIGSDAVNLTTLNTKDGTAVHKSGTETITGAKTFTNSINRQGSWTAGTAPSSNQSIGYNFTDSTGAVYGSLDKYYGSNGDFYTRLTARKTDGTGNISIIVGYNSAGDARATAPTPDTTTNTTSTQIATTGWVNTVGNNVMHLTGNESASGDKTFTGTIISTNKGNSVPINVLAVKTARGSGNFSDLIGLYDTANNCRCATIRAFNTAAEHSLLLGANNFNDGPPNGISITYDSSNNLTTTAHTPSSATNDSTEIATTAWVKNASKNGNLGIPNYAQRISFTSSSYSPASNGIIVAKAYGGASHAQISTSDDFVISRADCADGSNTTNIVWAIVKKGDTYKIGINGTASKWFIPFA